MSLLLSPEFLYSRTILCVFVRFNRSRTTRRRELISQGSSGTHGGRLETFFEKLYGRASTKAEETRLALDAALRPDLEMMKSDGRAFSVSNEHADASTVNAKCAIK